MKQEQSKWTPQAGTPQGRQVVCVCIFLVLAVVVVFGQTAHFKFVGYDDDMNVFENPVVEKGLSVKSVGWAFTHQQTGNWVPLTTLSHMLDCQIFGLRAGGHHLVNVLWHAANAVLLFLVLRQMTGSLWRSAFVAALFAVHPLRAESVAWVSERKDVMSGFFFLLAIGAYLRYLRNPSTVKYILMVLAFGLGLLAKSMAATLPFALLLLDYWPLGRLRNWGEFLRRVGEKIPLIGLAAGGCVAAALAPGLVITGVHRLSLLERMANALVSYVVYVRQMIFPAGLAVPYPIGPSGQPCLKTCLAFVLLSAISAWVVACRKKYPCLLAGWLWYLGMLLPVIGIIQISADAAHADRYTYLPGIGSAVAATWAAADGSAGWKHRRLVLGGMMMTVMGALTVCGHIQTSYWRNDTSLWRRAVACTSGNYIAHNNLGSALAKEGKSAEAIAQYRESLQIAPAYKIAHFNLGVALMDKGDTDGAITQYRQALAINPGYVMARNNLGVALRSKGDLDEAIEQYEKALSTDPNDENSRINLGNALRQKGDVEGAIAQYRKTLEINPDDAEARINLGIALIDKGEQQEAIAQYRKALEINPLYEQAEYNLGIALASEGQTEEAIAHFRKAVKIKPDYSKAYSSLGLVFFQKGDFKEAIGSWQQALEIKPDQADVQNNLAWLLATSPEASLRQGAKAIALAERSDKLNGGTNAAVLHTLAAAYAESGRYGDAAATARRALELAMAQKDDDLTNKLPKEIKLYESGAPMRETTR